MSSGEGLANNNKTPYFTRFFYLGVDIFVDPPKWSSTVKLFKPAAGAAIFTFSTKKNVGDRIESIDQWVNFDAKQNRRQCFVLGHVSGIENKINRENVKPRGREHTKHEKKHYLSGQSLNIVKRLERCQAFKFISQDKLPSPLT